MTLFERVRWKNFVSTGNVWTEVDLCGALNTLIVGRNGHGKSTLLDAITFALFGKAFRNINLGQLVNSVNNQDCMVELEFSISSVKFMIRRGMKPQIFEIYRNGKPLEQDANLKDFQKYLEKHIIKCNYKSFTKIVLLGSKSYVPFMKLKSDDRRAIIEDLLDIEIFSSMNRVTKDYLKQLQIEVKDNSSKLTSTQSQIELQKKYVEDSKKSNKEQIDKKRSAIAENDEHIVNLNNRIQALTDKIDKSSGLIQDRDDVLTKLDKLHTFETRISQKKGGFEKEVTFYNNHDNCPKCHQDISQEFKSVAVLFANDSIVEHDKALNKLVWEQSRLNTRFSEIEQTNIQISKWTMERAQYQNSVQHIIADNQKIEKEIGTLIGKKVLSDDMVKVSTDLLESLKKHTDDRKILIEKRVYHEMALNVLPVIKAQIIKQYLPIINKLVNKYLQAMDLYVNFELNEEFDETIKSSHRHEFTYDSFSDGEKQVIDLALLFAWRDVAKLKNSMNTNLLIFDEVFDSSLDVINADLLHNILNTLPHDLNVFVISHRELLHDKFSKTIRFEKKGTFSSIV